MSIDRYRFKIGICPSPGKMKGRGWRVPVAMTTSYDVEANRLTVRVRILKEGRIKPDKILILKLCPEGHACGCDYAAEIGWLILEDCSTNLFWQWPEAAG